MATIRLKKSSVASNAPGIGDLAYGEIAINYADGRLYYKNSSNVIKNFVDSDLMQSSINTAINGGDVMLADGSVTMTGVLDMGAFRITDLGAPSTASDATNKAYVDSSVQEALSAIGASIFPAGVYGRVDSAGGLDAFGIAVDVNYDCRTQPTGNLITKDLGGL